MLGIRGWALRLLPVVGNGMAREISELTVLSPTAARAKSRPFDLALAYDPRQPPAAPIRRAQSQTDGEQKRGVCGAKAHGEGEREKRRQVNLKPDTMGWLSLKKKHYFLFRVWLHDKIKKEKKRNKG